MSKKWSQVEASPEYQALAPQDRFLAKREYFDSVVSSNSKYISLSPENQEKAKDEFFGGKLVDEMPENQFQEDPGWDISFPLPSDLLNPLRVVSRNVRRAPARVTTKSIVDTGKTAANSASSLAEGLANVAGGALQELPGSPSGPLLKVLPGAEKRRQTVDVLGEAVRNPVEFGKQLIRSYGERYGGAENAARTVAEDPFGFVADVAAAGGVAGSGLRNAGRLAKSAELTKAGTFPTFNRLARQTGESTVSLGSKFQKSPQKLQQEATQIYRDILRPTQGEVKAIQVKQGRDIDRYYRLAAEERIPIRRTPDNKLDTSLAVESIKPRIQAIHDELNSLLRSDPSPKFDLASVATKAKNSLKNKIKNADELVKAQRQVDKYINSEISLHGQIINAETLNNIKQGMWSVGYDALRPTAKPAARQVGSTIRKQIENAFPDKGIRALNQRSGDYQGLINLLENAQGRVAQGGKMGQYFANVVGAVAGSKVPLVGPLAGAYFGGKISRSLAAPERMARIAGNKMTRADQLIRRGIGVPKEPLQAEIIGREIPLTQFRTLSHETKSLPRPSGFPGAESGRPRPADVGAPAFGRGRFRKPSGSTTSSIIYSKGSTVPRITFQTRALPKPSGFPGAESGRPRPIDPRPPIVRNAGKHQRSPRPESSVPLRMGRGTISDQVSKRINRLPKEGREFGRMAAESESLNDFMRRIGVTAEQVDVSSLESFYKYIKGFSLENPLR